MNNIYSTPELPHKNSEIGRRWLVADATSYIQGALRRSNPEIADQIAADIARARFAKMQLVERPTVAPESAPTPVASPQIASAPPIGETILEGIEQATTDEAYLQLLADIHDQIDEAHAA